MKSDNEIERFIRIEMINLDKITGISTMKSAIIITNSCDLAGTYSPYTSPERFSFSRYFFTDTNISTDILIYIVRHEYAHCLNFRLYGKSGHDLWFKHCCETINCFPDESIYEYIRNKTDFYRKSSNFT